MKLLSAPLLLLLLSMLYLVEVWGKWLAFGSRLSMSRAVLFLVSFLMWVFNREAWYMSWLEAAYLIALLIVVVTYLPTLVANKGSANVLLEMLSPFVRRRQVGEHKTGRSRYVIDFSRNIPLFLVLIGIVLGIMLSGLFLLTASYTLLVALGVVLGILVGLFGYVLISLFLGNIIKGTGK